MNGGGNNSDWWWWTSSTATTWTQPPVLYCAPTDWEKAAVKAEPEDEFSWLRKRVQEIEGMAFA